MADRSQVLTATAGTAAGSLLSQILSNWKNVPVTPEHIAAGTPGDGKTCPIVLAAKAVYPWLAEMDISGAEPYFITQSGRRSALHLVPEAVEWIGKYDRAEDVSPITFRMNLD